MKLILDIKDLKPGQKMIEGDEMLVSIDEYILISKDEHGNVINAKKIVLEKKNKEYPKTTAIKQYTSKCQTAKLIELGFPEPSPKYIHIGGVSYDSNHNYSIGELIEFLPLELEPHPDMARRTIVGNEVLYCDEYIDWVELRFNQHKEIIDNLFDACVTLKEEGVI